MKRFLTIPMLVLILLNAVGFYGVFLGVQFKNSKEANEKLDDDQYSDDELITFKIPLTVPYSSDSRNFERVTGEFEHNGDVYRLVKQRLVHDTLSIVCIKDIKSKRINQALTDYVKTFTDHPVNSKQQGKLVQGFIKDYLLSGIDIQQQCTGWTKPITYSDCKENNGSFLRNKIKYPPKDLCVR